MNVKTLKWLTPVISYFLLMGLIFIAIEIQVLVLRYGIRNPDLPITLPDCSLFIIFSPVILFGYLLLPLSQYVFRKNSKRFNFFAGTVILCVSLFLWLIEYFLFGYMRLISLIVSNEQKSRV